MKILAELLTFFLIVAVKFVSPGPLAVRDVASRSVGKYPPGVRPCFKDGNCPPDLTCIPNGPRSWCIKIPETLDAQEPPKIAVEDAGCGQQNCPTGWICAVSNGVGTCHKPSTTHAFMLHTIKSQEIDTSTGSQLSRRMNEVSSVHHSDSSTCTPGDQCASGWICIIIVPTDETRCVRRCESRGICPTGQICYSASYCDDPHSGNTSSDLVDVTSLDTAPATRSGTRYPHTRFGVETKHAKRAFHPPHPYDVVRRTPEIDQNENIIFCDPRNGTCPRGYICSPSSERVCLHSCQGIECPSNYTCHSGAYCFYDGHAKDKLASRESQRLIDTSTSNIYPSEKSLACNARLPCPQGEICLDDGTCGGAPDNPPCGNGRDVSNNPIFCNSRKPCPNGSVCLIDGTCSGEPCRFEDRHAEMTIKWENSLTVENSPVSEAPVLRSVRAVNNHPRCGTRCSSCFQCVNRGSSTSYEPDPLPILIDFWPSLDVGRALSDLTLRSSSDIERILAGTQVKESLGSRGSGSHGLEVRSSQGGDILHFCSSNRQCARGEICQWEVFHGITIWYCVKAPVGSANDDNVADLGGRNLVKPTGDPSSLNSPISRDSPKAPSCEKTHQCPPGQVCLAHGGRSPIWSCISVHTSGLDTDDNETSPESRDTTELPDDRDNDIGLKRRSLVQSIGNSISLTSRDSQDTVRTQLCGHSHTCPPGEKCKKHYVFPFPVWACVKIHPSRLNDDNSTSQSRDAIEPNRAGGGLENLASRDGALLYQQCDEQHPCLHGLVCKEYRFNGTKEGICVPPTFAAQSTEIGNDGVKAGKRAIAFGDVPRNEFGNRHTREYEIKERRNASPPMDKPRSVTEDKEEDGEPWSGNPSPTWTMDVPRDITEDKEEDGLPWSGNPWPTSPMDVPRSISPPTEDEGDGRPWSGNPWPTSPMDVPRGIDSSGEGTEIGVENHSLA